MEQAKDSLRDSIGSLKEGGKVENGVKVESELPENVTSATELEAMIDKGFTRE